MIAISKLDAVLLCLAGREAIFWGKVHWSLCDFFQHKQLVGSSFLQVTDTVFRAEMWPGAQAGRQSGVTFVSSCNVALWEICLYFDEWGTCVVIRLPDQPALNTRSRLIHSHWLGSPILRLLYYLQRQISARAKFHPSPPPLREIHTNVEMDNWHRIPASKW